MKLNFLLLIATLFVTCITNVQAQYTYATCATGSSIFDQTAHVISFYSIYDVESQSCIGANATTYVSRFPDGELVSLEKYARVDMSTPVGLQFPHPQPNLSLVMGTISSDQLPYIDRTNAETTGQLKGLHVGHWANNQFHGFCKIVGTDSLIMEELSLSPNAVLDIYGPVYITKEIHNAGTINIKEGGSLTLLPANQEKFWPSVCENIGTINGPIFYNVFREAAHHVRNPLFYYQNYPAGITDTTEVFFTSLTEAELAAYWASSDLQNTDDYISGLYNYTTTPVNYTGYFHRGKPLSGARFSPYLNDVKTVAVKKAWNNSGYPHIYSGRAEDMQADATNTGLSIVINDSVFNEFDIIPESYLADTSLFNNGVFEVLQSGVFQEPGSWSYEWTTNIVPNATINSWIDTKDVSSYNWGVGWPTAFSSMIVASDISTDSYEFNRVWRNENNVMKRDSLGTAFFGFDNLKTPDPLLSDYSDPITNQYVSDYPAWYRSEQYNTSGNFVRAAFHGIDFNTPQENLGAYYVVRAGSKLTPTQEEWKGYPFFNSTVANSAELYDAIDSEPALSVKQTDFNHEVKALVPANPATQWVYAPNGDVFAANEYQNCLLGNDSASCYASLDPYTVGAYGFFTQDPEGQSNVADLTMHQLISNPTMGYLDFNKVATQYFQDNPNIDKVGFATYVASGGSGFYDEQFTVLNPGETPVQNFNRRSYYRYNDEIINGTTEYWVQLLEDLQIAGASSNPLIAPIINDYVADSMFNSTTVINYLQANSTAGLNTHPLGRYLQPGGCFWIDNTSQAPSTVSITPSMAIYDYDFPDTKTPVDISGDLIFSPNRSSSENEPFVKTTFVAIDFRAANSYFPKLFFDHTWNSSAVNGVLQDEDVQAYDFSTPSLVNDFKGGDTFELKTIVKEKTPHNASPLRGFVPQPDSAFCIVPIQFQQNPSDEYPMADAFTQIGIKAVDVNGVSTGIKYLSTMDTLWYRKGEHAFPLELSIYFTQLTGDLNGDGVVNVEDILIFQTGYGTAVADANAPDNFQDFDFNGDGLINITDYLNLIQWYEHTLHADGSFIPKDLNLINEVELGNQAKITTYLTDLSTVGTVDGRTIRFPGEEIYLYNDQFERIAYARNTITLPPPTTQAPAGGNTDTYVIVTTNSLGYFAP